MIIGDFEFLLNATIFFKWVKKGVDFYLWFRRECFRNKNFYGKLLFSIKRKIHLSETDATGAIYFTELLKFATEAFEEFLEGKRYEMPVVSAKATYSAPLRWNDEIEVKLSVARLGESSIELHGEIVREGAVVGRTEIVHVFTREGKKEIISEELREKIHPLLVKTS